MVFRSSHSTAGALQKYSCRTYCFEVIKKHMNTALFFTASLGLERDKFDNKTVSFEEHIKFEHNMWNYLYFIVLVRVKNKTDYTGPESYVAQMIKVRDK